MVADRDRGSGALRIRPCVRAVITDPTQRILLVHITSPSNPTLQRSIWECPGGGIDPGESATAALARELHEELGLGAVEYGGPIWWQEEIVSLHPFPWDGQRDTFFWIEVGDFEPHSTMSEQERADEGLDAMRWWTALELRSSAEAFAPRHLPDLVDRLFTHGRPTAAVRIEAGSSSSL